MLYGPPSFFPFPQDKKIEYWKGNTVYICLVSLKNDITLGSTCQDKWKASKICNNLSSARCLCHMRSIHHSDFWIGKRNNILWWSGVFLSSSYFLQVLHLRTKSRFRGIWEWSISQSVSAQVNLQLVSLFSPGAKLTFTWDPKGSHNVEKVNKLLKVANNFQIVWVGVLYFFPCRIRGGF